MKVEEVVVTAISKTIGESILAPIVGNGSLQSGIVKLGIAYFAGQKLKGIAKGAAYGLALDGAEDILIGTGIMAGLGGFIPANRQEGVI